MAARTRERQGSRGRPSESEVCGPTRAGRSLHRHITQGRIERQSGHIGAWRYKSASYDAPLGFSLLPGGCTTGAESAAD
jgi:hypothetical protein